MTEYDGISWKDLTLFFWGGLIIVFIDMFIINNNIAYKDLLIAQIVVVICFMGCIVSAFGAFFVKDKDVKTYLFVVALVFVSLIFIAALGFSLIIPPPT